VGGWTTVANNIASTTFTSTGLPVNTIRYYRVRTVTPAGNSAGSIIVSGRTLPLARATRRLTPTTASKIDALRISGGHRPDPR
jgi:hypothetical protein